MEISPPSNLEVLLGLLLVLVIFGLICLCIEGLLAKQRRRNETR